MAIGASTGACTMVGNASVTSITLSAGSLIQGANTITTTGAFTQSGGTFTGGSATITIGTDLVLSTGTFNSTSGLLEIDGQFNQTGGTFSGGTGRVILNSSANKNFVAVTGSTTFKNLYINDGLIGYWKLDETATPSVDSSGYGRDAAWSSPTPPTWSATVPTAVKFTDAKSLSVNATDSYVSYTSPVAPIITIAAWIKATAAGGGNYQRIQDSPGYQFFIDGTGTTAPDNPMALGITSNRGTTNGDWRSPSNSIVYGTWYHIAATYDSSSTSNNAVFYINGVSQTVTTKQAPAGTQNSNAGTSYIGNRAGKDRYFNGLIDDFRVYDRALTAAEIAAIYAGDEPTTSGATQTLSSGNVIVSGDLTIASGTLAAGTKTITVGGSWWKYGGIFTAGATGNVTFNGSAAGNTILTWGSTLGGLTIAGSGAGAWTVSDTDSVTIGGDFGITGGVFTSTNGLLDIQGAFTKTSGTFNGGTGRVMLSSTTSKTFASNSATFYDLYVNDGLIGYWKLDEAASPSLDSSGYGRTATWNDTPSANAGLAPVNFTNVKSLSVDSSDDYASFTTVAAPIVTVAAWANVTAAGGGTYPKFVELPGYSFFYNIEGTTAPDNPKSIGLNAAHATTAGDWRSPSNSFTYGSWHHVAFTYDSSNTGNVPIFYIDGVAQTLTTKTSPAGAQTDNAGTGYIGNRGTVDRYLNGLIDDVRIYNRILTPTEISALYIGNQPGTGVATQTLSGSPIISNDLVIASGTLAAGANAIQVGGDWWNYGGMFTTPGLVTFKGAAGSYSVRSSGQMFGGITVNQSGGTWTMADRLEMSPASTLTMTLGAFDPSTYTFRGGNIDNNGVAMSTGKVVLDGNTDFTTDQATFTDLRVEPVAATNLVGYWKLDAGQGATAKDFGSGAHDGTLTNSPLWIKTSLPSTIKFYNPAALDFDGTSDYVDIPAAAVDTRSSFSACAWVNVNTGQTGATGTAITIKGTFVGGFILQQNSDTKFKFMMLDSDSTGGTQHAVSAINPTTAATWYHLCGTFNSTNKNLLLYVNGTVQGAAAVLSTTWQATGHTLIGAELWTSLTQYFKGKIDDVRIYDVTLSAAQVAALAAGTYPAGLSGTKTYTLGANTTVSGAFDTNSGTLATGIYTMDTTSASATNLYGGTYSVGSTSAATGSRFRGGLTVNTYGTLNLPTAGGNVYIDSGKTLTIDGTLSAASGTATIQSTSGTYAFTVGSGASATPTLNITGLAVKNTDANGMNINIVHNPTTSTTTFTRFDNIAFSNGVSGAGNRLLQIYAPTLYLTSNGCTFDASTGVSGKNVTLMGDNTTTETRAMFGKATCTAPNTPCENYDDDDDSDLDGVGGAGVNGGSVIQWLNAAMADTAGTIEGFPTPAFDWNLFTYYRTYVTFHDVSGTTDRIYVRDTNGNDAGYHWDEPLGVELIGAPRFDTDSVTHVHYVYVATTNGRVYRLKDNLASLVLDTDWSVNPYDCTCAISTPLGQDTSNLYWGGTASGNKMWILKKSDGTKVAGVTNPVTTGLGVISGASPALWTSTYQYIFMGGTSHYYKVDTTNQVLTTDNSACTGTGATVNGRLSIINNKVYGADNTGKLCVLDATSFGTTSWSYHDDAHHSGCTAGQTCAISSPLYVDYLLNRVFYGDGDGHLYANTSAGVATGFPYQPSASDAYDAAPFYNVGVMVAGTTTGKLYVIDVNGGSGPVLKQTYRFGATTKVSGIGYDKGSANYMIATSDATNKDGKLFYIAAYTIDPSPGSN